ncbi:hypothetical protein HG772_000229 [Salmonella enterica]|nr:hypothetical protein [Salmonella enterica]ECZ5385822.1 hypothetical protein [Salmonella enterica subsp. enterica serovar Montevideo]ECF6666796.1 hypothetical protein [Salmonella enterica]EFS0969299.1 hypothetical protein [Salmonella enterica]EGG9433595.1 hypothetical protein [Salmonella enterica]
MSLLMKLRNAVFVASCSAVFAVPAFAETTGPDFTSLTSNISFSSVIAGVMAIAAGIMGLKLAIVGARKILAFMR